MNRLLVQSLLYLLLSTYIIYFTSAKLAAVLRYVTIVIWHYYLLDAVRITKPGPFTDKKTLTLLYSRWWPQQSIIPILCFVHVLFFWQRISKLINSPLLTYLQNKKQEIILTVNEPQESKQSTSEKLYLKTSRWLNIDVTTLIQY